MCIEDDAIVQTMLNNTKKYMEENPNLKLPDEDFVFVRQNRPIEDGWFKRVFMVRPTYKRQWIPLSFIRAVWPFKEGDLDLTFVPINRQSELNAE